MVIEIPMNADPIKYEVDRDTGAIFVDRFMSTAMHYPCNYGYVPHTLSGDGDPVDVLVITPVPVITGVVVRCRPVGMLRMEDKDLGPGKWVKVRSRVGPEEAEAGNHRRRRPLSQGVPQAAVLIRMPSLADGGKGDSV